MTRDRTRPANKITPCALPEGSRIIQTVPGSHFADCYRMADNWPELGAFDTFLALAARTPGWMNALMSLRNQAVRLVGLKHLGAMKASHAARPASAYQIGDRVGIFTLRHVEPNEVILGDDDKHLRVQVSVFKHVVGGRPAVSLSTVVHIHNTLGHIYMGVVGPVHKRIVPLMLAQATRVA
jgi:Protein of unknown function (DUF2867)